MAASLDEINVISFNCWGLKYISKHRKERMEEIGYRIATSTPTPNIVGLQEYGLPIAVKVIY
jgi:sphingomyelin phosphodiesterase 2